MAKFTQLLDSQIDMVSGAGDTVNITQGGTATNNGPVTATSNGSGDATAVGASVSNTVGNINFGGHHRRH